MVCFGGDDVIAENVRDEQRKFIKYNHLVANLLTFHTLVTITSALRQVLQEAHTADREALAKLSPYQTEHINRFGNYSFSPNRTSEPLEQHLGGYAGVRYQLMVESTKFLSRILAAVL